jgi:beta-lactamase regulating signal transducer with metallopeptidase domain
VIVALLVKPALVIGAAWVLTTLLRGRSAAARHAVWAGAIAAILVVPVIPVSLPEIPVTAPVQMSVSPRAVIAPVALAWSDTAAAAVPARLPDILLIIWLAGVALLGTRRLVAQLRLHRIVRRARVVNAEIRVSDDIGSPAVAGVLRPVILLPRAAVGWAPTELRAVLVHERAHIARGDGLVNLAGDAARIAYWCNPLVHWAVRRMRVESERACDDRVVLSGAEPAWYARLLLSMVARGGLPRAATAMARPKELESRLVAVLDKNVRRVALPHAARIGLGSLALLLTLPISAMTLRVPQAPEPDQRADSLASPLSERLPVAAIPASARAALLGPDSALARVFFEATARRPTHAGDLVAERAAWALAQVRGGELVPGLLAALDSRDWRVQSYAAWSLGVARDPRAVDRLLPLLQHPVWRLRAMAAHALRASEAPVAEAAMAAALADAAWQVRLEAVEYFDALGMPDRIRPLLTDRHIAVRLAAERALNSR